MKQTKKEIKILKEEQEQRLKDLKYGYLEQEDYKEVMKQVSELNRRKKEIEEKYFSEVDESIKNCEEEIRYFDKILRDNGYLDPKNYSETVQKAFKNYHAGSTYMYHRQLVWVSENEKYALFKVPSHTGYVGRMSGSKSSPSEWLLVDVALFAESRREIFYSVGKQGILMSRDGGRYSSKMQKEINKIIEEYEN